MTPLEEFREEIEAAIEALESSASTFGRTVAGDPGFVFGLRKGREPRLSTMERVRRRTEVLLEAKAAEPSGVREARGANRAAGGQRDQVPSKSGPTDLEQQAGRGSDRITATQSDRQTQPSGAGRSRAA